MASCGHSSKCGPKETGSDNIIVIGSRDQGRGTFVLDSRKTVTGNVVRKRGRGGWRNTHDVRDESGGMRRRIGTCGVN